MDLRDLRNAFPELVKPDDSHCNFYFVKKYDPELYQAVQHNEGQIRLDQLACAQNLRQTVTRFLISVFKDNENAIKYLENLDHSVVLADYETAVTMFPECRISPEDIKSIRRLSNVANHYEDKNDKERKWISYKSLTDSFASLHRMMKFYYAAVNPDDAKRLKDLAYDADYQQIGDYIVYQSESDRDGSCEAQYMSYAEVDGTKRYYVIREYSNIDDSVISSRENDVLRRMWNESTEYPQGIVQYDRIDAKVCMHEKDRRTYIVYKMNGKPEKLSQSIISKWDTRTRLQIMKKLCESVKNLHAKKVYHRNLQPDSVYVYEINGHYGINLTGFEFSKISDAAQTVISEAKRNYYPNWIFTAPEVRKELTKAEYQKTLWDKVDIYNLGVLLAFIMSGGTISTEKNNQISISGYLDKLQEKYEDNLLGIVRKMCGKISQTRPSANQVYFILNNCCEKMELDLE